MDNLPRIVLAAVIAILIWLLWTRIFMPRQAPKTLDENMRDFAEMARENAQKSTALRWTTQRNR